MPFTLIKGTYHVVGYSPDGDSVKFMAADPANWKKIEGNPKLSKNKNHVQLRFEGIDALELHYPAQVKGADEEHQPLKEGREARDFMLGALGIKNVKWNKDQRRIVQADDGVRGYILTRAIDDKRYGRPVSFVYAGASAEKDGQEVQLTPARLKKSINYKLVAEGYAYPTYYRTLFPDLRREFTLAVKRARAAKRGLWKTDKTSGVDYTSKKAITDHHPIFPKMFRRLIEHVQKGGTIAKFKEFLKKKKDGVLILPDHHTDALDYVVKVKGKRVSLTVLPEELVFDP